MHRCRLFKLGEVILITCDNVLQSQSAILCVIFAQNVIVLFILNHYITCMWYGVAAITSGLMQTRTLGSGIWY